MKTIIKTFLLLNLIMVSQVTYGQKNFKYGEAFSALPHDVRNFTAIDTAKYVITYSVEAIVDPVEFPNKPKKEILTLQIGEKMSKSYNQTLFNVDSIFFDKYIAKGKEGPYRANPVIPMDIYKNYPSGTVTVNYRLTKYNYSYKENYPMEFNWQLSKERKQILSYNCQKATCTFRGRNYTAWFSPEIPIKEGPYKFGGLPGLILQMNDDKNEYVFTCISISQPKDIVPIKYFKWQYKDITREKLNAYLIKVYKHQGQFLDMSGWRGIAVDDNGNEKDVTTQLPNMFSYNPIELQ
jgi:GLPGLI family protein